MNAKLNDFLVYSYIFIPEFNYGQSNVPSVIQYFIFKQDIVDTGATMQKLLNTLTKFKPASIKVARYGFVYIIVI